MFPSVEEIAASNITLSDIQKMTEQRVIEFNAVGNIHCILTVPRAEPDPISPRSARGQSGGLAKARPNLSEFAELQTDLAQTSPTLG
jgi:hypothetical protein